MLNDEDIFDEIEKIIDIKKQRYEKALKWESEDEKILSRVTQLEDSLIDAYMKYIRMKYYVKERKFSAGVELEEEIDEFIEIVGDE